MKKSIPVFAACIVGVLGIVIGVSAAEVVRKIQCEIRPDFSIVIDGQERSFQNAQGEAVYPLLYEGTTYLPVRAIGEIMGKTVYWYENEKRIELKDEASTVTDADVIITGDTNTAQPSSEEITLEQAKEIAVQKAGVSINEVNFVKARLERDDGIRQYDIEFWKENVEYSAEIRASDGQILSWDVDGGQTSQDRQPAEEDIGVAKAKEIALSKAGLSETEVTMIKSAYEIDDGVPVYDIEFRKDRIEYSAEIRASDGQILSWDADRD